MPGNEEQPRTGPHRPGWWQPDLRRPGCSSPSAIPSWNSVTQSPLQSQRLSCETRTQPLSLLQTPSQLCATLPLTLSSEGSAGSVLPSGQLPIVSVFSFSSPKHCRCREFTNKESFWSPAFPYLAGWLCESFRRWNGHLVFLTHKSHSDMTGFLKNIFTCWTESKGFIFDQIKTLRILQLLTAVLVLTGSQVSSGHWPCLSPSLSVPESPQLTVPRACPVCQGGRRALPGPGTKGRHPQGTAGMLPEFLSPVETSRSAFRTWFACHFLWEVFLELLWSFEFSFSSL